MEYRSQKIAYWYFAAALPLFVLQVVMGLWLAANYTFTIPQSIVNVFPFATARAFHTNLLVLWMLLGFMGGTYYIIPEETKSEIYSTGLAWFQLIALLVTGVTALVGFLFGWTQGRPLLEIPMALDFVVVIGALVFLFNVGMTIFKARNWTAIQGTLLGGLVFLALLYLFGIPFYRNLVIDWYYWWWVIHLWVEGAWELVTASIFAFVLMKITGVEREVVEKWLYVEIGLFLFTGLAGTGHHYYWIGAPRYWLWIGGIFSALEPLPILLMVIDTMHHVKERKAKIVNPLTWTYAIGCAVMHLIGAGVWGFLHTLPQINYYTHGSQVTVSHGHLAFFGAYALLNLMTFYYAMPKLKGIAAYDDRRGKIGFWTMCTAMMIMGLTFGVAGVLQSYIERVLGMGYMVAQGYMRLWMGVTMAAGVFFLGGLLTTVVDLFTLRPGRCRHRRNRSRFRRFPGGGPEPLTPVKDSDPPDPAQSSQGSGRPRIRYTTRQRGNHGSLHERIRGRVARLLLPGRRARDLDGGDGRGGMGAVRPRPLQPAGLHGDDDLRRGVLHPAALQRADAALALLGPHPLLPRQHRADRDGGHRAGAPLHGLHPLLGPVGHLGGRCSP